MKIFCTLVCFLRRPQPTAAAVQPAALRCEYRVNPLGIDVARPRLRWIIESAERSQRQTAYRVLVATSANGLRPTKATSWIPAASPRTRQSTWSMPAGPWVRGWRASGRCGRGTHGATHRRGAGPHRGPWACWIERTGRRSGSPTRRPPVPARYRRTTATTASWPIRRTPPSGFPSIWGNRSRWTPCAVVRTGRSTGVPTRPASCFQVRLKIEAGQAADGSDLKVVVDRTAADIPNPGDKPVEYRFPAVTARLGALDGHAAGPRRDKDNFGLALAEMEVLFRPCFTRIVLNCLRP